MFTRVTPGGNGQPFLHSVDITGRNMRPVKIGGAASTPTGVPAALSIWTGQERWNEDFR